MDIPTGLPDCIEEILKKARTDINSTYLNNKTDTINLIEFWVNQVRNICSSAESSFKCSIKNITSENLNDYKPIKDLRNYELHKAYNASTVKNLYSDLSDSVNMKKDDINCINVKQNSSDVHQNIPDTISNTSFSDTYALALWIEHYERSIDTLKTILERTKICCEDRISGVQIAETETLVDLKFMYESALSRLKSLKSISKKPDNSEMQKAWTSFQEFIRLVRNTIELYQSLNDKDYEQSQNNLEIDKQRKRSKARLKIVRGEIRASIKKARKKECTNFFQELINSGDYEEGDPALRALSVALTKSLL